MARLVDESKVSVDKTVIPKPIRTLYNINSGDILEWFEDGIKNIKVRKKK